MQHSYLSISEMEDVLKEFETSLKDYSFKSYDINQKEKVFVIEDSLVLYVGFLTYDEDLFDNKINCDYQLPRGKEKWHFEYRLRIEELTYNNINFNTNYSPYGMAKIKKKNYFYRYLPYFRCDSFKAKDEVSKLLAEIKLQDRINNWTGILYNVIVFELTTSDNKLGIGIFYTTQKAHSYVNHKCQEWIKNGVEAGNMNMIGWGVDRLSGDYSCHLEQAFKTHPCRGYKQRQFIIENYLKYFVMQKHFKDKDDIHKYGNYICDCACEGKYSHIERYSYLKPVNKWISEELVYNLVKKLYKNYKVIYQHRPFFLRSDKGGQMSYDVFIVGLNIAIEYQGKQHFEPVEFFGGAENYTQTVARDKLKQQLSEQNSIKIVYINYWEDINEELIKTKINEVTS